MAGNQFIKAYCELSKQYCGVMTKQKGTNVEVVDFYDLNAEDAKLLASNTDTMNLNTASNLRSCFVCGSRTVRGCNCAKERYSCVANMGYHYQCIYCSNLHLFHPDEGSEADASQVGQKRTLSQGQVVEISGVAGSALKQILVGVGWEQSLGEHNMDVDSSIFVFSPGNLNSETVYYGELVHPSGCIKHRGDNLVGGKLSGNEMGDSENIDIFLPLVPTDRDKLIFVINIYNCDERGQNLGMVRNLYIRLSDAITGKMLAEYKISDNLKNMTGLVIGSAYLNRNKWFFKAVGEGVQISSIPELHEYCKRKHKSF